MTSSDCHLHFIRHAQTTFNKATEQFKHNSKDQENKHKTFDQLSLIPEFRNGVRFNHLHIDCSITEKGKNECLQAKKQLELSGITPDLALVSPFNRTLQTFHEIFGSETQFPIIVEPLVGQIFKSSCDISHPLQVKKEKFPRYDFEECLKYGERWDLLKNSQSHLNHYKHILQNTSFCSEDERIKNIIEVMDKHDKVETQEDLLQRSQRFIKKLEEVYAPNYRHIVIVTHFMFLDCVSAPAFTPQFIPVNGIRAKNCQIRSMRFSELLEKRNYSKI